jgi:glutathione S-transferase
MVLTIHHLQVSQSDRILWLCEELSIPYSLKLYQRSPLLSPPQYLALHPIGAAPVITDGDIILAESGAVFEYILNIYGQGKLLVKPGAKNYADYLYWLHFANGTFQPAMSRQMTLRFAGVGEENNMLHRAENKVKQCLEFLDRRLGETGAWVAGEEFTAADVMLVFSLTTMRKFLPVDLSAYGNVLAYLKRVAGREAYRTAMGKGDPEMSIEALTQGSPPEPMEALKNRKAG